jgi:lipid II:glycine glycyltransferase (peptidoglycan interpeptide bridge formation enzyme)
MKMQFLEQLDERQTIAWAEFWSKSEHAHPRQHHLFANVERSMGRIPIFVIGERDNEIVASGIFSLSPFLLKNRICMNAICKRGPIIENLDYGRAFISSVTQWLKSRYVGVIEIAPSWYYPEAESVVRLLKELNYIGQDNNQREKTGLVDLAKTENEIYSQFSQSTRREMRRAERQNVYVKSVTEHEDAATFYNCLSLMHHERGLTTISEKEFFSTFELILKNNQIGALLCAYHDALFLGGLWLVRSAHVAHASRYVVVNEALRALSNLSIGPSLWWEGMRWAKARDCALFDMEGSIEEGEPNSASYEVQKFKRRFSPKSVERISVHHKVCNVGIYRIYKNKTVIDRIVRHIASTRYNVRKKNHSIPTHN